MKTSGGAAEKRPMIDRERVCDQCGRREATPEELDKSGAIFPGLYKKFFDHHPDCPKIARHRRFQKIVDIAGGWFSRVAGVAVVIVILRSCQ